MGCQKNKPPKKAKAGRYRCEGCGAVRKKKKKLCSPKKIKQDTQE